jgi:hypothetical protein
MDSCQEHAGMTNKIKMESEFVMPECTYRASRIGSRIVVDVEWIPVKYSQEGRTKPEWIVNSSCPSVITASSVGLPEDWACNFVSPLPFPAPQSARPPIC